MASEKNLLQLVVKAQEEWNKIKYYHQLVEIDTDDQLEILSLYVHCYLELSKEYRSELELTLLTLREELTASSKMII